MVDFNRLRNMDPAERATRDAASNEREYATEEVDRDRLTKKALVITLDHEPEVRFGTSGERMILLRGTEEGKTSPLVAVHKVPLRTAQNEDRDAVLDTTLRGLGGGDKVSLAGQWSKRGWNDSRGARHESWEFKTQLFEAGSVPLERMLENARADRLGVAPAVADVAQDRQEDRATAPVRRPTPGIVATGAGQSR